MHRIALALVFILTACSTTRPGGATNSSSTVMQPDGPCEGGMARQGYIVPSSAGNVPCPTGTQFCSAGKWSGPVLYKICENHTKSCGQSPHGTIVNGFLEPSNVKGAGCTPASKTCVNGTWTGPEVYITCSELN